MSQPRAVIIGVGNEYRRDDGVGPAVLAELERRPHAGLRLALSDGEPTQLLDVWANARLAVVIDAVLCEPRHPGRVHRSTLQPPLTATAATTHGLGIPEAVRLAEAVDRAPKRLVVYAVEAADIGFGVGLSVEVARAVPEVVRAVLVEASSGSGEN